jgi:NAD(P)-dependent dehydrogenase (short-subunit alcohol dehydrogenase family)
MDLGMTGKRAIVTGASRGIGFAIAKTLASEGASVAICARGREGLDAAVARLKEAGVAAYGEAIDVRAEGALAGFVDKAAAAMGGVDIVVSNVSTRISGAGRAWWRDTFETDLLQHVTFYEAAAPHLRNAGAGAVVFIASIASVLTQLPPEELAYGAMKAALVNFVGQSAVKGAPLGIRVNAVSPGPIYFEDGFWAMVEREAPALFEAAKRLPAMGRLGMPDEVARAVVFLASPAASYITGANLRIDGAAVKAANF